MDKTENRRKPGRPRSGSGEPEVYATFRLPDSLVQKVRMLAVVELREMVAYRRLRQRQ